MASPKIKKPTRQTRSWMGTLCLTNRTHYRTGDLKKLVRKAMEETGVWQDRPCTVLVDYARQTGQRTIDGASFYGQGRYPGGRPGGEFGPHEHRWWRLALPPDLVELTPKQITAAAQIAQHEIDHTRGLTHADMVKWWKVPVPWSDGLEIRAKAAALSKPKPPADVKAREALARIEAAIEAEEKRHATNIKRLRTRRRKALASVRYYERKAEANG